MKLFRELCEQKRKFKAILDTTDERISEWTQQAKKSFKFAQEARKTFEKGDLSVKNSILLNLGAHIVLKDLTLMVDINAPLLIIRNAKNTFEQANRGFEPTQKTVFREKSEILAAKKILMGG